MHLKRSLQAFAHKDKKFETIKSCSFETLEFLWDMLIPGDIVQNVPVGKNIMLKKKYTIFLPTKNLSTLIPAANTNVLVQCFVLYSRL